MNAQVIRILVNIQIIKITGKINSTPVASKSPSDFDTEVKAISADNALLFVFFAGIMIFSAGWPDALPLSAIKKLTRRFILA